MPTPSIGYTANTTHLHDLPDEIKDSRGLVIARLSEIRSNKLTVEQVRALMAKLRDQKHSIECQVAEVRAQGKSADSDWLARANAAIRVKGRQVYALSVEVGRLNRSVVVRRVDRLNLEDDGDLKTPEQVLARMNQVQAEKDRIAAQIDAAKSAATPPDAKWLALAERANRDRGRKILLLGQMLGRMNQEARAQRRDEENLKHRQQVKSFQASFVRKAKEWLPPDLFQAIAAAADEDLKASSENAEQN